MREIINTFAVEFSGQVQGPECVYVPGLGSRGVRRVMARFRWSKYPS